MKLGVFGGSFDPPHVGHLAVAQDAVEELGLDLLLLVPARVSPFKVDAELTAGELRADLLERSLAGNPALRVWRGELDRSPPSYTVDTLEEITERFPDAEIFLLMGEDQWVSFGDWRDPERILQLATVCVLGRSGWIDDGPGPDLPHRRLVSRRVDVSSTEVRDRAAAGLSIRYLVPEAVRAAIIDNQLYGSRVAQTAQPGAPTS